MDRAATRTLLLVNRAAGTGSSQALAEALLERLSAHLGPQAVSMSLVGDHVHASRSVETFVRATASARVVVAGGGGTLRAAAEGAWRALDRRAAPAERLTLAALRTGSGNLVARALGAARDPLIAVEGIAAGLRTGRTVPVPLIAGREQGREMLALAMLGFGQWGLVPGDIARWRHAAGRARNGLGRMMGIERLNQFEYRAFFALRLLQALVGPSCLRQVEVTIDGRTTCSRLLAGGIVNLPVRGLPVPNAPALVDAEFELALLLWPWRLRALRITASTGHVSLRVLGPAPAECFVDEDAEVFRELQLELAGCIHFAVGGDAP